MCLLLERWARAAGKRTWFGLRGPGDVEAARSQVRPGSSLTAYLDPEIQLDGSAGRVLIEEARKLLDGLPEHGELLGLTWASQPPQLDADYIATEADLEIWAAQFNGRAVLIGPYPDWLPDGPKSLTAVVPDLDGVVRGHPY